MGTRNREETGECEIRPLLEMVFPEFNWGEVIRTGPSTTWLTSKKWALIPMQCREDTKRYKRCCIALWTSHLKCKASWKMGASHPQRPWWSQPAHSPDQTSKLHNQATTNGICLNPLNCSILLWQSWELNTLIGPTAWRSWRLFNGRIIWGYFVDYDLKGSVKCTKVVFFKPSSWECHGAYENDSL